MHPDGEQIERFVHAELTADARAALDEHLAGCPACRARVDAVRRDEAQVDALLRQLDHTPPGVRATDLMHGPSGVHRIVRWAAGILFAAAAAGAAWALPGSPLRVWLNRSDVSPDDARPAPAPSSDSAGATPVAGGGMVLDPANAHVAFRGLGAGSRITIELVAISDVEVRTVRGRPAFDHELDRLVIEARGDVAEFEIRVPLDAAGVSIRLGDRTVFQKHAASITSEVAPDRAGIYVIRVERPPD